MTSDPTTTPLSGVRVIDAATLAAGPMVATLLSEFGAEVIKVEQPGGGDPLRNWGPQKAGVGLMWKSIGRNKRTVTVNLRHVAGQDLLRRLADVADVLIMNARPSTLEKWGLNYERLASANPRLIMLHVTAFGGGGPQSDRPGFGTLGEAMSGFANLTGQPDGPPTLPPFMLADGVASLAGASAVLAALYQRDHGGGSGQYIDINLIDPLTRLLEHPLLAYDQLGTLPKRSGSRWDVSVPRNTYRAADGKWIAMSASSPSIALRVYNAIGREDLAELDDFRDPQRRIAHADEIDGLVAAWIADRPAAEALSTFADHEVAACPVYDARELLEDEHLRARGTFTRVPDSDLGSMTVQGPVAHMSKAVGRLDHLGRGVGADTREVLSELLGVDDQELAALKETGVV